MSGSAPTRHPFQVQLAGRDVAPGPAGRGPRHVGDRHAVARVEEARRAAGGQRPAVDAGPDARHRVAAVLQDLGDVADVVGARHGGGRQLGGLVGVQGALVVGVLAVPQRRAGELDVEVLELHAEGGDVLLGEPLDRLELRLAAGQLAVLAGPAGPDRHDHQAAEHQEEKQHARHGAQRTSRRQHARTGRVTRCRPPAGAGPRGRRRPRAAGAGRGSRTPVPATPRGRPATPGRRHWPRAASSPRRRR